MAILFQETEGFVFGNREDVCNICAQKEASRTGKSVLFAKNSLKGKYETRKIFKTNIEGKTFCFCPECLLEISKQCSTESSNGNGNE